MRDGPKKYRAAPFSHARRVSCPAAVRCGRASVAGGEGPRRGKVVAGELC